MRTCVLDLPGLSNTLLDRLPEVDRPDWLAGLIARGRSSIQPVLPAVTLPMQATLTTGALPQQHGVVANGFAGFREPSLVDHFDLDSWPDYRRNVSFWEQSNDLVQTPRVWRGDERRVAMLFFQSSIGAADVIVTPKPEHTPDGRTVPETLTRPADLNQRLKAELGPFPLQHFWGPLANLESSRWIASAAGIVWDDQSPDLMLTYIPHLDYDLQRLGPSDSKVIREFAAVLEVLTPLVEKIEATGGRVILLSEYGMTDVQRSLAPNQLLREADLLTVNDRGEVDYDRTPCFAMCDHQIAHVYGRDEAAIDRAAHLLADQPAVAALHRGGDREAVGLDTPRAGDLVLIAAEDAWFEYRWWADFTAAPDWAWTVDIHRKPGYDPTELFLDAPNRRIRADEPELVRGSHGAIPTDVTNWPVLLGVADLPTNLPATDVAALL